MSEDIEAKSTKANYARWHERLERPTTMSDYDPRHGVLIEEILGDDDGPYETDQS